MKIVIDMNLSPQWVDVFRTAGHECVHWSKIGSPTAPDREILLWARSNGIVYRLSSLVTRSLLQPGVGENGIQPQVMNPLEMAQIARYKFQPMV